MPVEELAIENLGPFDQMHFVFDPSVNVFVGPNNSGKTTALMALAEAVVYPFTCPPRLYKPKATPKVRIKVTGSGLIEHALPWRVTHEMFALMQLLGFTAFVPPLRHNTGFRPKSPLGEGTTEQVNTPKLAAAKSPQSVRRTPPGSYLVTSVPTQLSLAAQDWIAVNNVALDNSDLTEADRGDAFKRSLWISPGTLVDDQAVVSKMVELDYRAYRKRAPRYRNLMDLIAETASEITHGFRIEFAGIEEDERGLFPQFSTPDGNLPLDKLSQGTQSVIQWISHILIGLAEYYDFPSDLHNRKAVLIVDEIDAHMHPEWQRRIVPTMTKALPNCQFFFSSHSPLVLSGLKEGQIQLLQRDENNRVVVTTNQEKTIGWSVDETLRWIMGMSGTLDANTEDKVSQLSKLRKTNRLSASERELLEQLRTEVSQRLKRSHSKK